MRIDFRTKTGKRIGSVTLLQFVTSWAAFLTCLMFVFTKARNLSDWMHDLFDKFSLNSHLSVLAKPLSSQLFNIVVIPEVAIIKTLAASIAFYLAVSRFWRGFFLWSVWTANRNFILLTRLITSKIKDEIGTFPNRSPEDFRIEIAEAVRDEAILHKASADGIITNQTTQNIVWVNSKRQDRLFDFENNDLALEATLKQRKKEIASAGSELSGATIKFYVSPVQPSVLFALKRVISECKLEDCVKINSFSNTGPQTLERALKGIVNRVPADSNRELSMLAAPLSAYVMFESSDPETPNEIQQLSSLFEAVCVLIKEPQDILIVDDGNRVPVRKPKLLYYNNSTAEECWAKSSSVTKPIFDCAPINLYPDYLAYLKGKAPENQKPLKPGDAIVTWPPLTRFFEGCAVGNAHFNRSEAFEEHITNMSRILLFAEKTETCSNTKLVEFGDLLTETILRTFLQFRMRYERSVHRYSFEHWRFLSTYHPMFKGILGIER